MNDLKKKQLLKIGIIALLLAGMSIFFCAKDPEPVLMIDLRDDLKLKGTLCGTVSDVQGKPLSAVSVTIDGTDYSSMSLPDGSFKIPGVASGLYTLRFRHYSFEDTILKNIALSTNQNLLISDTIEMKSSKAKLTGRIISSKQKAVSGAGLTISYQPFQTLSGDSGFFSFSELISGQITVVAACRNFGWGEKTLKLQPGDSADISITLDREGGSVRGRVVDTDNNPVKHQIVSTMNGALSDTTNDNGEYSLENLPSSIPLTISAGPANSISGLRVTENGQLSGVELMYVEETHSSGITLGNPTVISTRKYPVYMVADVHSDSSEINISDLIYSFIWDTNYDNSIDTITTAPELVLQPELSWGKEKRIGYGVILMSGDTVRGGTIRIMCVPSAPQVDAIVSNSQLRTGEPAFFTGNTITLDKSILKYIWDFDDGSTWIRTDTSNVIHRYSKPGVYTATFKAITDSDTSSDSVTVTVSGVHYSLALDSLLFRENISLDKAFNTDSLFYRATVPFEIGSVSLRVVSIDSTSLIICNNDTLNNINSIDSIPLNVGKNTIKIRLISRFGLEGNYTVSITRQANADAALSNLTAYANGTRLVFDFNPDSLNYHFKITDTITNFSLRPQFTDKSAIVLIGTDTIKSDSSYSPVLKDGDNILVLKAIAPDRIHFRNYTVSVFRTTTQTATLAELTVSLADSSVDLNFDPDQYAYTFKVPYTTSSFTLQTLASQEGDIVTINGKEIVDTTDLKNDLSVGENSIRISVFSPQTKLVKTYSLMVIREANPDASLKSVSIFSDSNNVDLKFSNATFSYNIPLPWGTDIVHIKPLPEDSLTKIRIGETTIPYNGSYLFSSTKPIDTVQMEITAPDAKTRHSYTFVFVKQNPAIPFLTNLEVSALEISLLDNFSPEVTGYTITVPYETQSILLIPESEDSAVILLQTDTLFSNKETFVPITNSSTVVSLLVKYPGIDTGRVYTITITKDTDPGPQLSSDANVKSVGIYADNNNLNLEFSNLSPTYNIPVPWVTDIITIRPLPEDSLAKINIKGNTIPFGGSYFFPFTRTLDTIKMEVTAQNLVNKETFTFIFSRQAAPLPRLSNLVLTASATNLLENFSPQVTSYTVSVPFETQQISLMPVITDSGVILFNSDTLKSEENTTINLLNNTTKISLLIKYPSIDTGIIYNVTVNKESDSDSRASTIGLYGISLESSFDPSRLNYLINIPPSLKTVDCSVVTRSSNATFSVNGSAPQKSGIVHLTIDAIDTIYILVVSGDHSDSTRYYIVINRTTTPIPQLNELKIMSGEIDFLFEKFSSTITDYNISVPFETTALTVYASGSDSETIIVNTDTLAKNGSSILPFTNSTSTITIQAVHPEAGVTKTYTVHATRISDANSGASSITLNGSEISQLFTAGSLIYNAVLAPSVTSAELIITPESPNARISVQKSAPSSSNNYSIPISENDTIEISIISGDGTDTSTYYIYITRSSYTLRISKTGAAGGSISPSHDTIVNAGSNLIVSFTNTPDYIISELIINGVSNRQPGSNYTFTNIRQSNTLVAVFTDIPKYALRMSWTEGGNIGPQTIFNIHSNDTIDIYAKPAEGYLFAGWSVSDSAHVIDTTKLQTKAYLTKGDGVILAKFLPRILYVSTAGNDINNGYSWKSAKLTLQAALDLAQILNPTLSNPVQIWIAYGTYNPTNPSDINEPRTRTFAIPNHVHLYGGFTGRELSMDQRPIYFDQELLLNRFTYFTSLSGDFNQNGSDPFDAIQVLSGDSIILNGLTIANGFNNQYPGNGCGALLGNSIVKNCEFTNNWTQNSGGALSFLASTKEVTVDSCIFTKNTGYYSGGAIFSDVKCNLSISNSVFLDNKSEKEVGGAVSHSNTIVFNNCLFQNNSAPAGGALHLTIPPLATTEINRTTFRTNSATQNNDGGGAIIAYGKDANSQCKFTNCVFDQNKVTLQGADFGGGAISAQNISLKLMNCTFYANTIESSLGGALYIRKDPGYGERTTIVNCIFWENKAPGTGQTPFSKEIHIADYTTPSVSNTCIRGADNAIFPGQNNFTDDPIFMDLLAQPPDLSLNGELIEIKSSCIDKGSDVGAPEVDITGKVRDNQPDVGAYEY